mmetsp:Transcript_75946/g.180586  ORF Transcript_75946/g.180586 Transcript_75946/m.180586 type:complete len:207 (-) Transcript_75946:312-932(-)
MSSPAWSSCSSCHLRSPSDGSSSTLCPGSRSTSVHDFGLDDQQITEAKNVDADLDKLMALEEGRCPDFNELQMPSPIQQMLMQDLLEVKVQTSFSVDECLERLVPKSEADELSDEVCEFSVQLYRGKKALGMTLGTHELHPEMLMVRQVKPNGAVEDWNAENPAFSVTAGCQIIEVNGFREPEAMLARIKDPEVVDVSMTIRSLSL